MSTDGIVNKDLSHSASFTPPGDSSMTINQTTPASSPLDTLKALALRSISQLEFVIDELGGGSPDVPEWLIEFVDGIRKAQYKALSEHMDVGVDEWLGELRILPEEAFRYDDGSPVSMAFKSEHVTSVFYPRYDSEERVRKSHLECVAEHERRYGLHEQFDNVVRGTNWGHDGPQAS
ncbi:hypothetical protein D3226_03135 [Leucobacter chromiireducens subsp. chromiireducens]|uniref:Uncharacterized protein n=2 Tax=Leucobacter TaxID=55968 RepID=A0ABS1SL96_9MICO|nr:hypothetical protein [Leucobacter chromiireducens subsp. chromiireducens]